MFGGGIGLLRITVQLVERPPTLSVKLQDVCVEFPEIQRTFRLLLYIFHVTLSNSELTIAWVDG